MGTNIEHRGSRRVVSTPLPSLRALRARLAAFTPPARWGVLAPGDAALAAHLPEGGLPLGALHEVSAAEAALAMGFIACLLARLRDARPVLWIAPSPELYPPGLLAYGFDPARLIQAQSPREPATLAAAETALREGAVAAVVAEVARLPRLAARRLQLAAQARGSTVFVLSRPSSAIAPEGNAAVTRWRLAPAPSAREGREPGTPCWRVDLTHARGGRPGGWIVEVATGDADASPALGVVAVLADAAPAPPARRRA
jgi:protein ImuA